MTPGERRMIRAGFRWDVIAYFPSNSCGVRVETRKTRRGAMDAAVRFAKRNRVETSWRLRHDPLLDDVMNKRSKRR